MSALPCVQHVAPVAPVKKTPASVAIPAREKKPIDKTAQQDWQDALQTRSDVLREDLVLPVASGHDQQSSGDSKQGKDEQEQKNAVPIPQGMHEQHSVAPEAAPQVAEESLPLNMNRLGGLIAAFVVHSVVHGSWAVQIPLSHELLQETVLHMRCEQAMLTLRFETSDWHSRETLMRHAPTLLRRLRQSLPQLLDVMLVTD
jgi:Type III secretion protein (HpaP)